MLFPQQRVMEKLDRVQQLSARRMPYRHQSNSSTYIVMAIRAMRSRQGHYGKSVILVSVYFKAYLTNFRVRYTRRYIQ